MKVTIVNGSPRKKGNSKDIVNALCESFAAGTEVKSYDLVKLKGSGCLGCMACKGKSDRCIIKDELTSVYEEMHDSDVLVIASPIYFGDVSAQTKAFIDRLFHLFPADFHDNFDHEGLGQDCTPCRRLKAGTKLVFITAQGGIEGERHADVPERYAAFFQWLGFDEIIPIRGLGDPAAWKDHRMEEAFAQARNIGAKLTA